MNALPKSAAGDFIAVEERPGLPPLPLMLLRRHAVESWHDVDPHIRLYDVYLWAIQYLSEPDVLETLRSAPPSAEAIPLAFGSAREASFWLGLLLGGRRIEPSAVPNEIRLMEASKPPAQG